MKVLLTGAGSYFASYLIPKLLSEGVVVEALSSRKITGVTSYPRDFENQAALRQLIQKINPDFIIHLAGTREDKRFSEFIAGNVLFAANLFDAVIEIEKRIPILVVGSAAEYGNVPPNYNPVSEDYSPQPENYYGASKYMQTILAQLAMRQGLPVIVARVFNVIGPNLPNSLVLGRFIEQLKRSPAEIVMGNLDSVRDFIDVRDVVEIIWRLIQNPNAYGKVINVCSGSPVKIEDLLIRIQNSFGVQIKIKSLPMLEEKSKPNYSCGSPEKLMNIIGPYVCKSLDESIQFLKEYSCTDTKKKVA